MKHKLAEIPPTAAEWLPQNKADGSQVGVNYADAVMKPLNVQLPDGRKVAAKRRGLKVSVAIGDDKGESLLRRAEYGPRAEDILAAALAEAFKHAGGTFTIEDQGLYLELVQH